MYVCMYIYTHMLIQYVCLHHMFIVCTVWCMYVCLYAHINSLIYIHTYIPRARRSDQDSYEGWGQREHHRPHGPHCITLCSKEWTHRGLLASRSQRSHDLRSWLPWYLLYCIYVCTVCMYVCMYVLNVLSGNTPLHLAAMYNHMSAVRFLAGLL